MHIQFQGAARTVTGSMHVLTVGGRTILLDCGMYHGKRDESRERIIIPAFSGHADRTELLRYIGGFPREAMKGIFLMPGDEAPIV
jgi:Cft2 family RNA processing exonuclease